MPSVAVDSTSPTTPQSVAHPPNSGLLVADVPPYNGPITDTNDVCNGTPQADVPTEIYFPASQTRVTAASYWDFGRVVETLDESASGPLLRQMQPLVAAVERPNPGPSPPRIQSGESLTGARQTNSAISLQRSLSVTPHFQVVEVLMEVEDAEDPEQPPPYSPRP
ncbi:hypothetical protein FKP32DRAFT_1591991 [Trametes sanguinea]|nr:hypothetical protein FKP32DRAFT_1591991 [Trametes sanguinea]